MSDREPCILECGRTRRKNGKECRACYKKLWMRKHREKNPVEKPMILSIDESQYLIDKLSYDLWWGNQ